jgi:hypothetical protein
MLAQYIRQGELFTDMLLELCCRIVTDAPDSADRGPDPNRLGSTDDNVIGIEPGRQI